MISQSIIVLGAMALVLASGLAYFAKKFAVEKDERVSKVLAVLPGSNCGACGLAGCEAAAEAIVKGDVGINICKAGGGDVADKVAAIMGKDKCEMKKEVVHLFCDGNRDNCQDKFDYDGPKKCSAANLVNKGPKNCEYGCIGFGDCAEACPFSAIKMINGLPVVDKNKCTGCGVCVTTCPKSILHLVPNEKKIHVLCSSKDLGKDVIKKCRVGCIACRQCEKACPVDAIHVIDNNAVIDYGRCIMCAKCVQACPRKIIVDDRAK